MEAAENLIDQGSPLVIDHGERISEQTPADDGLSELAKHKQERGYTKAPESVSEPEPPPLPEAAAEPKVEEKKPEKWSDPDTGDTYDMRHKVARRIKTVLEDRGKERARAEAAEKRVNELTALLIERGATPKQAEQAAQTAVDSDPEPDPGDTAKYPEGQFDKGFIKDMGRWAARQETKSFAQTTRTEQQQAAEQAAEREVISRWQETLPQARQRYADFDEVIARIPNTPENAPIVRIMTGSPVGNDVVYVLGTQAAAMDAYNRAPNHESRLRLLHHIEAQLIQAHRGQATKTTPATTKAPPPTSPVQSGPAAQVVDWSRTDDPDQLSRWKAIRGSRR